MAQAPGSPSRHEQKSEAKRPGARERSSSTRGADRAVREFFEAMARALTAGDGAAVAAMWEPPAFVLGDEMTQTVSSSEELEAFFGGAKQEYNARGIVDTKPEITRLDWVTDRMAVVSVRWPYLDERGHERGEEASTYTLRRNDDGELRVRVAVMHGARGWD